MKTQKTTVKLIIDDVFNLGDVEVEWVASLVVNSSGITVKVEIPDQVIYLPRATEDSFDDMNLVPVKLTNNEAFFFAMENDGVNSLEFYPKEAWVNWEKKSMTVQFED